MRVFADQAGTLTLGLEGDAPKIELSETVTAGWNNVVFDVSSAATADPNKAVLHIDFETGAADQYGRGDLSCRRCSLPTGDDCCCSRL